MTSPLPHTVARQTLTVDVPNEEVARDLVGRVSDLHRDRLIPLLGAVLDDLAPKGEHVRIDRLVIDLGDLPVAGLEDELCSRFERAAREALRESLSRAEGARYSIVSAMPESDARLELLAHYLTRGTLPVWASHRTPLSCEAEVIALLEQDPDGLSEMLQRHADEAGVIERLVRQLSDSALRRLLAGLEPDNAALVLLYITDLRALHRAAALIALDDQAFARLLWIIVLRFFLQDPGSQFNRKNFVRTLLLRVSASEAVPYGELVAALERGLVALERSRPLGSSLPAVIRELVLEHRDAPAGSPERPEPDPEPARDPLSTTALLAAFEAFLRGQTGAAEGAESLLSVEEMVYRLAERDAAGLAASLRREGGARDALERLVVALTDRSLGRVLHVLDAQSAAVVIEYLFDLRSLHRARALVSLGESELGHLLWLLSLRFFVRDPGTHFNRKSFVRSLLASVAATEPVSYTDLLAALQQGLTRVERGHPLRSSLPGVLRELAEDLARGAVSEPAAAPVSGNDPANTAVQEAALRAERQPLTIAEAALRWLLHGAVAPFSDAALLEALRALLEAPREGLKDQIASAMAEEDNRARWAARLPEPLLERISALRAPRNHRVLIQTADLVASAWRDIAPPGQSASLDRAEIWRVLLGTLALSPEPEISVQDLLARYLAHIAARVRTGSPDPDKRAALGQSLLVHLEKRAEGAGVSEISATLRSAQPTLKSAWAKGSALRAPNKPPVRPGDSASRAQAPSGAALRPLRGKTSFGLHGDDEEDLSDPVYVQNAGLVLTAALLPRLFGALDWLVKADQGKTRLRDEDTVSRACHLMQWMAFGVSDAPEPALALNKVLSGVPLDAIVAREITLTEAERALGERVLRSILQGVGPFQGTSIEGLRQTFLAREGKLIMRPDKWVLTVQRKVVDILLEQVPWSYSVIVHPWMAHPLHVKW